MATVKSSEIELTTAQKDILVELLTIHDRDHKNPVKGKEIAARIDRNPGTIRTQMQSLKSLQLVEGIPGPKGGYKPTPKAYEVIDLERSNHYTPVPIEQAGEPLDTVTVTEFDFINLHHPDRNEAEIHVEGSLHPLEEDENVTIGPAPRSNLVVKGNVKGLCSTDDIFVITIEDIFFEEQTNSPQE